MTLLPATLIRVIDGDSYWLDVVAEREVWPGVTVRSATKFPIRLLAWDTPERGEPNYREASNFAAERLGTGMVEVGWPVGMSFRRYVCAVWVDSRLLGELLEEAGLAVPIAPRQMRLERLP